ncbi:hypothetical protein ACFY2J_17595 [Streptomyces collinus]
MDPLTGELHRPGRPELPLTVTGVGQLIAVGWALATTVATGITRTLSRQ